MELVTWPGWPPVNQAVQMTLMIVLVAVRAEARWSVVILSRTGRN